MRMVPSPEQGTSASTRSKPTASPAAGWEAGADVDPLDPAAGSARRSEARKALVGAGNNSPRWHVRTRRERSAAGRPCLPMASSSVWTRLGCASFATTSPPLAALATASSSCIVLLPGEAHTSRQASPLPGRSAKTGSIETTSCRLSSPVPTPSASSRPSAPCASEPPPPLDCVERLSERLSMPACACHTPSEASAHGTGDAAPISASRRSRPARPSSAPCSRKVTGRFVRSTPRKASHSAGGTMLGWPR